MKLKQTIEQLKSMPEETQSAPEFQASQATLS
jgi:hypothetical protein